MAHGNDHWSFARFSGSQGATGAAQGMGGLTAPPLGRAPQTFNVSTPPVWGGGVGGQAPGANQTEPRRLTLDLKLARIDKHMYTDAAPETWHKNIRTYMLGRHSSMKPILDAIERMGDVRLSP